MTACDISAESDVKSFIEITPCRCDPGGKIGVGLWTVGNKYAALFHKGDFCVRAVDTVCHDGWTVFTAKKTKLVISFPVK